jgi:predicted nucleic acid-binding Zn ribbon protein
MKDAPIAICPPELCRQRTWGKGRVKRQVGTGAGLIFKGSGFYITDYRSEGYKEAAKKETSGSSSEPKSSDSKPAESKAPESKPAETKKVESKPAVAEKAKSSTKKK